MNSQHQVLITGASGFIGSYLTRRLLQEGYHVKILARKPIQDPLFPELKKVHQVCLGELNNPESLNRALKDVQTVFHLAGLIAYKKRDRPLMEEINVKGTQNLLQAAEVSKVETFVHMSSVVTIGAGLTPTQILDENSSYNLGAFDLGYSVTKKKAEELVLSSGLSHVILNPSTVYGAGDARKGSRSTQLKVAQGKFKFYPPGGANIVAIEDVIEATLRAWKIGKKGQRYILSSENLLLKQIFEKIAYFANSRPPQIPLPRAVLFSSGLLGEGFRKIGLDSGLSLETARMACLYHWFHSDKAQKELGIMFKPADFAIENSVRWLKDQKIIG